MAGGFGHFEFEDDAAEFSSSSGDGSRFKVWGFRV